MADRMVAVGLRVIVPPHASVVTADSDVVTAMCDVVTAMCDVVLSASEHLAARCLARPMPEICVGWRRRADC